MTAALTFTSAARDPVTGTPRTVTLTISGAALFVGIAPARASRHVDPHTSTADFTPQLGAILEALKDAATPNEDGLYKCLDCGAMPTEPCDWSKHPPEDGPPDTPRNDDERDDEDRAPDLYSEGDEDE